MYFTEEAKTYPTCKTWFNQLQCTNGHNCYQLYAQEAMSIFQSLYTILPVMQKHMTPLKV